MDINSYIAELPSVEASSFEEYAQLMQLYILTAKKSDSFEGTKRLLTELYPDNAHFIYELLQNAEDAEADTVTFEVYKDRLVFKHNGRKIFTLKDVKGITNIGNSTKKEDHTKVGKFGVGFKSVFAFTDVPKIYSDDFNFAIEDMLLPRRIDGVKNRKAGETYFDFPFKGSPADAKKCIAQIEKELRLLDASTIMFLDNINNIHYVTTDGSCGDVKKEIISDKIYKIDVTSKKESSYWLILEKSLNESLKGEKNKLHVNIAYALKRENEGWRVMPTNGTVNIFFPAVKEISNLRFNINGPFASTVARDSIRECEENEPIFAAIKQLAVESLMFMKNNKMISMSLYETVPNNEDPLSDHYSEIRDGMLQAFNDYELVLSASGGCHKATELVRTLPGIQNIFAFDEIQSIMDYSELDWSCTVPVRNKNCRAFFDSLTMRNCSYKTFSRLFDDEHRAGFEKLVIGRGLSWFRNLYVVLIDLNNSYQEGRLQTQLPALKKNLRKTKMILTASGKIKTPAEVYLCVDETPEKSELFVNERLKGFSELDSFWEFLDIQSYDDKATAQYLVKQIEKYRYPSNDYFDDLMKLVKKSANLEAETIKKSKIWFSDIEGKFAASELYLDLPYEDTGYANIACVINGINQLSDCYKEHYNSTELRQIVLLLKSIGISTGLEIIKSDVKRNPLYHECLYKYSDNVTALSTSEDYTIAGLDDLLDSRNVEVSKIIWNYMINLQMLPRYCKASFSPNRTTQPRKCDSYLIQKLREKAWLPSSTESGFFKPADVSKEMLPDGFDWVEGATFLNLILFGTDRNRVRIQSERLINDWGVDAESEQAKALRALLSNPQMAGRILNLVNKEEEEQKYNLTEAIEAQTRTGFCGFDDEQEDDGSAIRNVDRRRRRITDELKEGLKKPKAFREWGLISRTKMSPEERTFLESQYHGRCQICGCVIKKWNGQAYFEGINLIDTRKLDDKLKKSLETGWNSLCLCPNHAAEYKYGSIDLTNIKETVETTAIKARNAEMILLPIIMQGKKIDIKYTPKHFLALKTAFAFFERLENE